MLVFLCLPGRRRRALPTTTKKTIDKRHRQPGPKPAGRKRLLSDPWANEEDPEHAPSEELLESKKNQALLLTATEGDGGEDATALALAAAGAGETRAQRGGRGGESGEDGFLSLSTRKPAKGSARPVRKSCFVIEGWVLLYRSKDLWMGQHNATGENGGSKA